MYFYMQKKSSIVMGCGGGFNARIKKNGMILPSTRCLETYTIESEVAIVMPGNKSSPCMVEWFVTPPAKLSVTFSWLSEVHAPTAHCHRLPLRLTHVITEMN